MNKEQLQTARLPLWGQNENVQATQDAIQAWMEKIGFCPVAPLLLPGGPPTPTLLEACLGRPLPQPTLAERASIAPMLARLVQAKVAVPLLLISPPGGQPDFVASLEALPFLYAMRGDRNWRMPPTATGQGRVSQLALHCWQELDRNGPQTLAVLRRALGQEVTEAAVLRALGELWGHLRVFPQLQAEDEGADLSPTWDLLSRQFPKQVSIGAGMGQPAALSGILSLYLGAVIAASDEEIVAFLSPLASQSRVREMLHGLTATRQLGRAPYEGGMLLHLKDGLPPELLVEVPGPEEEVAFPGRPARKPMDRSMDRPAGRLMGRPVRRPMEHRPMAPAALERGLVKDGPAKDGPVEHGPMEQHPTEQGPMKDVQAPRGPIQKWAPRSRPVPRIHAERSGPVREGARKEKSAAGRPHAGGERQRERPEWKQRPSRDFGGQRSNAGSNAGPNTRPRAGSNAGPGTGWKRPERTRQSDRPEQSGRPGRSATGKPGPEKFRAGRPVQPAGRPAFRAETSAAPRRPFPKRMDATSGPRKQFPAPGGPRGEGRYVRRDGPQEGPRNRPQGGPQDRPGRTFSGAPKVGARAGAKTWPKNRPPSRPAHGPTHGPSFVSKTRWGSNAIRDARAGKLSATEPGPEGPATGKFGRDKTGPNKARSSKGHSSKGGFSKPGFSKPGSRKSGPDKSGSRRAKDEKTGAQAAGSKQPFWAKPMHRKRKKHD
ncbi:MAG: hypothetical protein ACP5EP_11030 [Acidobacteriaceae bacterium]